MIRKPAIELTFINAKEPMSTIEIDLNSLPGGELGYGGLVESELAPLAAASSDLHATVYVYEGPSVNFGSYGYSAFFGVAGDRRALGALYASFCRIAGLNVRHGDQIRQSQAIRQYHLEDGKLWRPEEEDVWYADAGDGGDENHDVSAEGEDKEALLSEQYEGDDGTSDRRSETSGDEETAPLSRTEQPLRFRAARSDASVGGISRSIEAVYRLPEGSVALRGPDRKVLRSDATIRTLRRRWE